MAEIFGIPNSSPSQGGGGSENTDQNVLGIFAGLTEVVKLLKTNNEQNEKILSNISPSSRDIGQTIDNSKKVNSSASDIALNANTKALESLTKMINQSTEIKYSISGDAGNFFSKLLVMSSSDKRINATDRFGKVFANLVERIAGLTRYTNKIEDLGQAMHSFFASSRQIGKGLALAAAGIALFGLSVITFMDAITLEDLVKFVGIMTAIRIGSEILRGAKFNFALAAAGIALLGLSIWAFNEVVTTEAAINSGANLIIMALGIRGFMEIVGFGSGKNLLGKAQGMQIAATLAILGGAIWVFNKALSSLEDFDMLVAGKTIAVAGVSVGLIQLIGSPKSAISIASGAAAAATVGGALGVLGWGIQKFLSFDIDMNRAQNTAIAAGLSIGVLGLIGASGPVALAIAIGAAAAATVGGALGALAWGLNKVSTVNLTEQQGRNFGLGIGYAAEGLSYIGRYALEIGIGTPLALGLAGATIALSKSLGVIQNMPTLDPLKIMNFKEGVRLLMDVFESGPLSIISNIFKGGNSVLYTGIAAVTVALATAIRFASWVMPSKDSVTNLTSSLDIFVKGMSTAFDSNKTNFKSIHQGINAFQGIGNMAKSLADTVYTLGNLQFENKEYRNGQWVVTSSRTMGVSDFARVGQSIGAILNAITSPLADIGSSKDTYSIGGFTITNPFSNKVKSGIDSMMNIGKIFAPLTSMVNTFAVRGIDQKFVLTFNKNLGLMLGGIGTAFVTNESDLKKANKMELARITNAIKSLSLSIGDNNFVNNMPKFKTFSDDLVKVKSSLNELNIEKLSKFNIMLNHINEMARNGAMRELVEVFNEFIEKFIEFTDYQKENAKQQSAMTIASPTPAFGTPLNLQPQSQGISKTVQPPVVQQNKDIDVSGIITAIDKLSKMFRGEGSSVAKVRVENYSDFRNQ